MYVCIHIYICIYAGPLRTSAYFVIYKLTHIYMYVYRCIYARPLCTPAYSQVSNKSLQGTQIKLTHFTNITTESKNC